LFPVKQGKFYNPPSIPLSTSINQLIGVSKFHDYRKYRVPESILQQSLVTKVYDSVLNAQEFLRFRIQMILLRVWIGLGGAFNTADFLVQYPVLSRSTQILQQYSQSLHIDTDVHRISVKKQIPIFSFLSQFTQWICGLFSRKATSHSAQGTGTASTNKNSARVIHLSKENFLPVTVATEALVPSSTSKNSISSSPMYDIAHSQSNLFSNLNSFPTNTTSTTKKAVKHKLTARKLNNTATSIQQLLQRYDLSPVESSSHPDSTNSTGPFKPIETNSIRMERTAPRSHLKQRHQKQREYAIGVLNEICALQTKRPKQSAEHSHPQPLMEVATPIPVPKEDSLFNNEMEVVTPIPVPMEDNLFNNDTIDLYSINNLVGEVGEDSKGNHAQSLNLTDSSNLELHRNETATTLSPPVMNEPAVEETIPEFNWMQLEMRTDIDPHSTSSQHTWRPSHRKRKHHSVRNHKKHKSHQ
jgi:hypothetical protein